MSAAATPAAVEPYAFACRVLEIYSESDEHDLLFWRVGHPDPGLHFYAKCNDLFWWGTADAEEITPANLPTLERVLVDPQVLAAARTGPIPSEQFFPMMYLSELFAARVRGMRPQRPCYKNMSPEIATLFDACGPERDRASEG